MHQIKMVLGYLNIWKTGLPVKIKATIKVDKFKFLKY